MQAAMANAVRAMRTTGSRNGAAARATPRTPPADGV